MAADKLEHIHLYCCFKNIDIGSNMDLSVSTHNIGKDLKFHAKKLFSGATRVKEIRLC